MFSVTSKVRLAAFAALAAVAVAPVAGYASPVNTVSTSLLISSGNVTQFVPFSTPFGGTINPTSGGFAGNTYSMSINDGTSINGHSSTASTTLVANSPATVSFTADYTFSLSSGSYYAAANLILTPNSGISGTATSLYELVHGSYVPVSNLWSKPTSAGGYLGGGSYELVVTGTSAAGKNTSFSGNLTIGQAPIPAALPLFGSALVVVGLMARRRQQAAKAA